MYASTLVLKGRKLARRDEGGPALAGGRPVAGAAAPAVYEDVASHLI